MITNLIGFTAIACYLISTILVFINSQYNKSVLSIAIIGLAGHIIVIWQLVVVNWVNLGFFHSLSFASAFVLLSLFFTYRWYSLPSLLGALLPIATISLSLQLANPGVSHHPANIYLDTHILLSILAYSFLCIAAILTVITFIQYKLLKAKKFSTLLQSFPPLVQIEATQFKVLTLGFLLLSTSLISGFIFLDDIFAQRLIHKTFFSILSWVVFAILLIGKIKFGWRGKLATELTLTGFFFILLGYFGSKLIKELLL